MPDATRWVPIGSITNKLLGIDGVSYTGINATYPTGHPSVPDTDLEMAWDMETLNGGDIEDFSANSNLGVITGAVDSAGQVGRARDFNGSSDKIQDTSASFVENNVGTVAFWVSTDDNTANQAAFSVSFAAGAGGSTNDEWFVFYAGALSDQIRIQKAVDGVTGYQLDTPNNIITDSSFNHIAVTSDGSTIRLFFNGAVQTLSVVSGSNNGDWFFDATDSDTVSVGVVERATPILWWNGDIDEVLVFSRVLSDDEIGYLAEGWTSGAARNSPIPPTSDLQMYFDMETLDANGEMLDLSGDGNDGTITGAVDSAGIVGRGRLFVADDKVQDTTASFVNNTEGTVACWIKFTDYTAGSSTMPWTLSVNGATDDEYFCYWRGDTTDFFQIRVEVNAATTWAADSANNIIADNSWHHIVVTSDSLETKFYLDASQETITDSTGENDGQWFSAATQADTFTVGGLQRATLVTDFEGDVDEVLVWDRALSLAEITALYETGQILVNPVASS